MFGGFLRDQCVIELNNPDCFVSRSELKKRYDRWCQENGVKELSARAIAKRLRELGVGESKSGDRRWLGVRTKYASEQ